MHGGQIQMKLLLHFVSPGSEAVVNTATEGDLEISNVNVFLELKTYFLMSTPLTPCLRFLF